MTATHGSKVEIPKGTKIVIGWGAKTSDPVTLGGVAVLNHPDKIATNRNKLLALSMMEKAGVSVAPFITTGSVKEIGKATCKVNLPLIARTKYHQGSKGFWMCPTMTHVSEAINEGADYLQSMVEVKDEYRLHVVKNGVTDGLIYAVKKVKRTTAETEEAYIRQELDQLKAKAVKKGTPFDEATAEAILTSQAKKFAENGANMMARSNKAGWKFARVKECPKALIDEALRALDAMGLNFGAVDCCIDAAGKAYIFEVNSGPGLEETTFDIWVDMFKKYVTAITKPVVKAAVETKAKTETKVVETSKATKSVMSKKDALAAKVALMQDLVENTESDEEVAVVDRLFNRMFK